MSAPQKPPLTLAIDTSENHCSAALFAERMMAKRCDDIGRGHAEHLLPMLDGLLVDAGVTYDDLDRIVVGVGPGSFTGLRVGLSVARGLALTLNIPCVGISGLMSYAQQSMNDHVFKAGDHIHSVIKGRGSQVFYQMFVVSDAQEIMAIKDACNIEIEAVKAIIAREGGVVVGSADLVPDDNSLGYIDPVSLGARGQYKDPSSNPAAPHYLRSADAVKKAALLPIAHLLNPRP